MPLTTCSPSTSRLIADLDARVLALENAVTTPTPPTPEPPGGIIDNTLPEPEEPEPQPGGDGLAVFIITPSAETAYVQAGAENMGDYVDPDGAVHPALLPRATSG